MQMPAHQQQRGGDSDGDSMAAATMGTMMAAMVGGTDNKQLKAKAEEMMAVATETATATEMATRRALIIVWRHAKFSGEMESMIIAHV